MGWTGARVGSRVSKIKINRCVRRCANRRAQVRKQVGFLYLHLHVHPFTHSFILTCSFLRPTFPPKLALCVPMFTYKANFGGKVGLKNEQVKMNEWVNGWTCKCTYRVATCAFTCALACLVTRSLVSLHSLTRAVTCAITRTSTCTLRIWYLRATRPSSSKPCLRTLQNS